MNRIAWGDDERTVPRFKRFLSDVENNVAKSFFFDFTDGEKQVAALLGQTALFPNPKPTTLIARLISQVCVGGDIVLDFFAGSGTTAHAVIDLGKNGRPPCRFILTQLPEPIDGSSKDQQSSAEFCDKLGHSRTIAEITKERIRRVIEKTHAEQSKQVKLQETNPIDLGFRVFKLDSSNIRAWEPNREDLPKTLEESVEHLKADRTEQDILFELLLKLGLDLTVPIEQKKSPERRYIASARERCSSAWSRISLPPTSSRWRWASSNGTSNWPPRARRALSSATALLPMTWPRPTSPPSSSSMGWRTCGVCDAKQP